MNRPQTMKDAPPGASLPMRPKALLVGSLWVLLISALSSSLVAGPVGKLETRFLRFQLFHRAVLVSFFFARFFLSLRITNDSAGFSTAGENQAADPRESRLGCVAWGCGSWGPRSLGDRSV